MPIEIQGLVPQTLTVTERELGLSVMQAVRDRAGPLDDAGCDWLTDRFGHTYIAGDWNWKVSEDFNVATLVDAANVLRHGERLKMDESTRDLPPAPPDPVDDGFEV